MNKITDNIQDISNMATKAMVVAAIVIVGAGTSLVVLGYFLIKTIVNLS